MPDTDGLYVGLMSGTSIDGIDCALTSQKNGSFNLLHTLEHPIPDPIHTQIAEISHSGEREIERLGTLDRQLGQLFAQATGNLLGLAGVAAEDVRAIGSHGQTIRHRPPSGGHDSSESFTLQIGDPNTIAEITGITTVADFRRRDMAAGGEGAPLAPAFHASVFGQRGMNRGIVNIGGIANLSLLAGEELVSGFDTGPGNTLMDLWIRRHHGVAFDRDGKWAMSGTCQQPLLNKLMEHPYFALRGPRSTGKEAFNLAWLEQILASLTPMAPADVQSTLAEYTALTIAEPVRGCGMAVQEIYVCGGGAHNHHVMSRLAAALPSARIADTSALGIAPDWVEAATFAWLAHCTMAGLSGNAPAVTGATGRRVLGGIYPGRMP